jgi:thiamine-monophosphate kinase
MPATPSKAPGSGDRIESEAELIGTFLAPLARGAPGAFGLRDDAALISPEPGTDLVVSSDPVIAGVHFFSTDSPEDVAWKALAVNASDLAAKGARPLAYILTLALPEAPERSWMAKFAEGLGTAQDMFGCYLLGGDTDVTPGPLSIGVTMMGSVPAGKFVRRQGAAPGDHVFVTGTIGDAALGLAVRRDLSAFADVLTDDERAFLVDRYLRPQPRLALAELLQANASAALDVSDGLLKDLSQLTGELGLSLGLGKIPLSEAVRAALTHDSNVAQTIVSGGGDYELLIAVPPSSAADFAHSAAEAGVQVSDLGTLEPDSALKVLDLEGLPMDVPRSGYDHFSR